MKDFLPIGSVITLKGGTKRVMICGRLQFKADDEKTVYDYSACYFPEGYIGPQEMFLFNNEDIDMVYFLGLQDVEEFKFRDYMNQQIEANQSE